MDRYWTQRPAIERKVQKLLKTDLYAICRSFQLPKWGTKDNLRQRIVRLIDDCQHKALEWKALRKEIKRVYDSNPKIKKLKRISDTSSEQEVEESEDQLNDIDSTEGNRQPIVLNIPKPVVNENQNPVNDNNYGLLSNIRQLNANPNPTQYWGNGYQMPNYSQQRPYSHVWNPKPSSASHQLYRPWDTPRSSNDYSAIRAAQLVPTNAPNPNYHPNAIQNHYERYPSLPTHSYAQQMNNSMHNNSNNNQNCAQNSNHMQNNCQSFIPGLMDPALDLKAAVEQQKRILSQIQRPLQSPDITSNEDIPPNEGICFKCLPKYKVIKTFGVKTIGSLSDKGFEDYFNLNVLDLKTIHKNSYKIQLRFGYINDIQTKEQKDCVPEYLSIDVNNQRVFQYTEAKETNTPFDLTEFCVFGTNTLRFSMTKQNYHFLMPCAYEMSFVSYETPESFLSKLKQKDCQYLSPESTQSLIQNRIQGLSQDEVTISVINTDTKVKLICPLSYRRIETPCRTHTCKHIECFDGLAFFRTNEFRYEWFCPICQECAPFDSLRIDGYFTEILDKTDESITALFVKSDGTYDLNKGHKESEVIELEDSDGDTSALIDFEDCIVID